MHITIIKTKYLKFDFLIIINYGLSDYLKCFKRSLDVQFLLTNLVMKTEEHIFYVKIYILFIVRKKGGGGGKNINRVSKNPK